MGAKAEGHASKLEDHSSLLPEEKQGRKKQYGC